MIVVNKRSNNKLFLLVYLLTFSQSVSAQWYQLIPPSSSLLSAVIFVNDTTGFIMKTDTLVYKTTDGGGSWTAYPIVNNNYFNNAYFLNKDTGFAVGGNIGNGAIAKTINGGTIWNSQNISVEPLSDIRFYNNSLGYAVGNSLTGGGAICKTIDGGATWNLSTVTYQNLSSVFPISPAITIACGNNLVIRTTDGGNNWSVSHNSPPGTIFRDIWFTSFSTGYVVGTDVSGNEIILYTNSAGLGWNILSSGNYISLQSIQFVSADTGFAVGSNGMVLRTNNAGVSWFQENSTVSTTLFSVHFSSMNVGYACGQNGILIKRGTLTSSNSLAFMTHTPMIYPNPAKREITVEMAEGKYMARIKNSLGQNIFEKKFQKNLWIDVSPFGKGLFLVEVCDEQGMKCHTQKVLLE